MNGIRKSNAMLIELVIVILFFAISAGVILQVFMAAHEKSAQSAIDTAAVFLSEDFAERFAACGQPAEMYLEASGFVLEEGGQYVKDVEVSERRLEVRVDAAQTRTQAGALDALTLTVLDGERIAVRIPVHRYAPSEETP